ncbi:discoidin domain-containing protein [Amycolatopsis sp. cg5]|uniref:discoidin domain-containing protein n=1 Tax=Amycolatopsis sp. cg5 TaxID=3238802 RepID=UPI0035238F9F
MKRRINTSVVALAAIALLAQPLIAAGAGAATDSLLSLGKTVTTSSDENTGVAGKLAVDGDFTTRWASVEGKDPQWLSVDLGGPAKISRVKIAWESSYAIAYKVQASDDGKTWRDVKSITNGDGYVDEFTGLDLTARHIRVYGTKRALPYGYSIYEVEVYGVRTGSGDIDPPSVPAGLKQASATPNTIDLSWDASTDNVGVTGYEILRGGNLIGTSTTPSYTDTSLAAGWDFNYEVRARDAAGNLSAQSPALVAKTQPSADTGTVIAVAGDIAKPELPSTHQQTADLVTKINPQYVITLGDNQYDNGTFEEFQNFYDKSWGKFKSITKPITGNHEWNNKLAGYKKYFGAIAYPQGKPYYSYDIGDFHFVAADSNPVYEGGGSEQITWIRKDLEKNKKACVVGLWHHPRFNSGADGDQKGVSSLWNEMAKAKADVVFSGHDHHYERTQPLNTSGKVDTANGVRSVIAGIGGDGLYMDFKARTGVEKIFGKHGILKLVLNGKSYSWEVIGLDGQLLDKAGPYTCR